MRTGATLSSEERSALGTAFQAARAIVDRMLPDCNASPVSVSPVSPVKVVKRGLDTVLIRFEAASGLESRELQMSGRSAAW